MQLEETQAFFVPACSTETQVSHASPLQKTTL